jgi:hypothetical protein
VWVCVLGLVADARFEIKVALMLVLFLCEIFFAKACSVTFILVTVYWIKTSLKHDFVFVLEFFLKNLNMTLFCMLLSFYHCLIYPARRIAV